MYEAVVRAARDGARKYAQQELELLKTVCSVDSGTGNEEGNAFVVDRLREVLATMDVDVEERYDKGVGKHIIAKIRPPKSTGKIILNAHLDTVFAPGDVQKHPVRTDGDWLWGLGAADCKGGVITSIFAVKIMQEAGLLPNREIVMIYNCDEETGSFSGRKIFQEEAAGADMALVFEPAREENGILTERFGIAVYDISVTGKTAHPGLAYHEGRSAVIELAYQTVRLYEHNNEKLGVYYTISDVKGGSDSGGVPEWAFASVSTPVSSAGALAQIAQDMELLGTKAFIEDCRSEAKQVICHPYMGPTKENRAVYHLLKRAGELLGTELPEQSSGGASDANLWTGYGVPAVCGLGPYMKDIHTFNERLLIPSMEEKTALAAVFLGILGQEEEKR